MSVATVVGFIALAGVASEFGVIMLLYLNRAWDERQAAGLHDEAALIAAIEEGAVLRVRPKAMTVAVILAGLIPIMWSSATGSEVMQGIAAPMVGGMITARCCRCSSSRSCFCGQGDNAPGRRHWRLDPTPE